MTKNLKGILKTCTSPALSCPLGQDSICQQNGSSALTMVTSHASQPMMVQGTHLTLSQSMPLLSHQMTHQPDCSPAGSMGCLQGLTPSFSKWSNALAGWMTGALQLTSSTTKSMMKSTRKSMQKFTGSSWTPLLLSKIVPYVNSALKHQGALKVLLTLKGWVPSPPVPSGAHTSPMMKTMTNTPT
jgi:hypothetical protein